MKKRFISTLLTLALVLSFMPMMTQTADAVSGPRPSNEAGIAIGFTHVADSEIMYLGSDKKTTASFEGFKYSSAVIVDWNRDTLIYDRYLLDHFVRESTRFAAWEEMVKAAADERYAVNNAEK